LPLADYWLDPKSKDFGPNAKFHQHDVAEAKKLLAAAGFGGGVEIPAYYNQTLDDRQKSALEDMATEAGFRFKANPLPAAQYNDTRDSQGDFKGIAYVQKPVVSSGGADPLEAMIRLFSARTRSRYYLGFDVHGRGDKSGDPYS